jgi:MinD-like ATPase involved in chromosome partitioning or flagellar assembly
MKTITFYSYKGGAGRSSTTLNTLPYLVEAMDASAASPIILLDMDLDSAGMTYLLDLDVHFKGSYDVKSFLMGEENWSDAATPNLDEHPLFQKLVPVGNQLGVENGAVLFLGVDDRKPIDNNQMDGTKEGVFSKLNRFCRNNGIKAVVMDSSAGEQFSAILATQAANDIVCCMRPTMQFRIGTFNYLHRLSEKTQDKRIVLLPTVVPNADKEIDGEFQRDKSIDNIKKRAGDLKIDNICLKFVEPNCFGINEVERFKWKEGVLYKIGQTSELSADEKEATKRYSKLAGILSGTID